MNQHVEIETGPNPVDRHVGLRIRMRRKELRMSQERLAETVGLTFQQIQKYERAANRVSASKLWEIAQALNSTISYFYDGLAEMAVDGAGQRESMQDFLLTPDGLELAACVPRIPNQRLRRRVLELVRALVDEPATAEA